MTATVETPVKTTEQLVGEHERMILDLQLTISDIAQGKFGVHHAEFSRVSTELESAQYELYLQDCRIAEMAASISKADDFAVGITAFVQALQAKVIELNASVEDLMAGGVATTQQPEIRVRIGHTHTLKDGWRCDSTTVEWTGHEKANWELIRSELGLAHTVGELESQRRHAEAIAPSS